MLIQALLIIRPLNILILCLTQFTLWFKLQTDFNISGAEIISFIILCLSVSLIAAAGYVVNDIYDQEIDLHNKPAKVYVNQNFSKKNIWKYYFILNFIALVLSLFLKIELLIINILSFILLFFYSYFIKRATVFGNFIIALLSATVVFEIYRFSNSNNLRINYLFLFYIFFSFLTTLLREIVKDLEDMNGDIIFRRKTLAIFLGIPKTKILLFFVNFVMLSAMIFTFFYFESGISFFSKIYLQLLLIFPFFLFFLIAMAGEKSKFSRLSLYLKFYMLLGILWLWTF